MGNRNFKSAPIEEESEDRRKPLRVSIRLPQNNDSQSNEGNGNNNSRNDCGKIDEDNGDDSDSDSIEDVTEISADSNKSSPEIIEVENSSDDSESPCNGGGSVGEETDESADNSSVDDDDSVSSLEIEDITDEIHQKKQLEVQKKIEEAEDLDPVGDVNEDEPGDGGKIEAENCKKRKNAAKKSSPAKKRERAKTNESPIEVIIDEKDVPITPGSSVPTDNNEPHKSNQRLDNAKSEADDGNTTRAVKERIIKLLNTGFHGDSNENEARNAMKLARKLMERYNLDQAMLLQERGDGSLNDFSTNGDADFRGGMVTVNIQNRKKKTPLASLPRWIDFLTNPVTENFHVESFKSQKRATRSRGGKCSFTFYGIRTNAQLAAYAFKIASERIALMTANYNPPNSRSAAETRNARLSYALGVVRGLRESVQEDRKREKKRQGEKLEKARRAVKRREAWEEDSDGEHDMCDNFNVSSSFDGGERVHRSRESDTDTTAKEQKNGEMKNDIDEKSAAKKLEKLEKENNAQIALVEQHNKIAEDVLKSAEIKLHSARRRKGISMNKAAYNKGKIDSKAIDLNQHAIQN
mmetsp:Transcript_22563/g.47304  ORF Transcript_22563/g.47304 Transcript_22563/m.47304 type:complete len:580 (+) Transcript_22563:61-1800(+)